MYHRYFILGNPDQVTAMVSTDVNMQNMFVIGNIDMYPEFTTSSPRILKATSSRRARPSKSFKRGLVAARKAGRPMTSMPETTQTQTSTANMSMGTSGGGGGSMGGTTGGTGGTMGGSGY